MKAIISSICVGFVVALLLTQCSGKSYKNHALLRIVPDKEADLAILKTFRKVYNVTWWKEPTKLQNDVEFSLDPKSLVRLYKDTNINFTILIKDLQSAFDKQKAAPYNRRKMESFNWKNYYRLDDIYDWLRDVSAKNPTEVQLRKVGASHENRNILAARLTLEGSIPRSTVLIEGGCHAREWMSPAFVTYMLHTLLNAKYHKDIEVQRIAHMYTWVFVPVMNPDGYEYSHTEDRLWRQNRRPGGGVDLNRNFDISFGTNSASQEKTSDVYCGEKPFSEPESMSMAMLARGHILRLEYYISFHSYGQNVILPYGHLKKHTDNYDQVKALADKAAERIKRTHGLNYKTGNSYETLGHLVSGTSQDWVKKALGVSYVATFELPDTGAHGFALPPDRILPTCQATMDGLLEFLTPQTNKFLRNLKVKVYAARPRTSRGYIEDVFLCDWLLLIYVVTIELPDKGYGFALPPDRILSACQATMGGLMEFLTPQSVKFLLKKDNEDNEARNTRNIASNEVYLCNSVIIMSCVINFLRYSFVFIFST